ncbi:unnamed protein product [Phaedon cochleariae]|uniref:Protein FAM207A n=1 Tax=Phaedon cochleariae TaxID=80249 RepID=A0A9N9SDX6_PHACE|nr:unnamed protein product [Phaedon cochleariae]
MGKIAKPKSNVEVPLKKKLPKHGRKSPEKPRERENGILSKGISSFSKQSFSESSLGVQKNSSRDESRDVKSTTYKSSTKSHGVNKIKKKDRLNMKKKLLLKKIDIVRELKKELQVREKRKNTALIGDTNPLHDALPSLEPLLKMKHATCIKAEEHSKNKKGVETARKRKKQTMKDVEIFKRALRDKTFKANPFETISNHIQSIVHLKTNVKK